MASTNIAYLINIVAEQLESYLRNRALSHQYAWWLLEHSVGMRKNELLATEHFELSEHHRQRLDSALYEITHLHKPLAYIIGTIPFGALTLRVKPPTLIARPETEEWCLRLIEDLKSITTPLTILDIGTGSGCVALSLAQALPSATVYAVDISSAALELARENATANGITNVIFVQSDLFGHLSADLRFDLIVSNPPYIPEDQWQNLDKSVRQWEDKNALIAADQGMAIIQTIIKQALRWLNQDEKVPAPLAQLVIEIDRTQAMKATAALKDAGYEHITVQQDMFGNNRVVSGRVKNVAKATQRESSDHHDPSDDHYNRLRKRP